MKGPHPKAHKIIPHYNRCEFCLKQFARIEEADGKEQKVFFYMCTVIEAGLFCPYPARFCAFADEQELFVDYLANTKRIGP